MKKPECLHIPTLYEGENAEIRWEALETDTNYIVERIFNETFSQALSGYTWGNLDTLGESWSHYDQEALNWNQIETRTGKGRNWERHDYEQLTWSQIEETYQSWKQLEIQEISFEIYQGPGAKIMDITQVHNWLEFDGLGRTWSSLEMDMLSWQEAESGVLPGLAWESIEARWLTFDEWEQKGLTFQELEGQLRGQKHRSMTDVVPIGAVNAMYQMKAKSSNGEESDYVTTTQLPVIPIFYRDGVMEYPVKAGKRYRILLRAQDVYGLDKVRMNLRYNQYLLELNDFSAFSSNKIIAAGEYQAEQLRIYCSVPGNVWFQSTRSLNSGECYTGSISLVDFIATGTGVAAVSLS